MDVKKGTFGMAYPDNILIPEIRLKVVMKEFCFIVLSGQHSRIIKGWREGIWEGMRVQELWGVQIIVIVDI